MSCCQTLQSWRSRARTEPGSRPCCAVWQASNQRAQSYAMGHCQGVSAIFHNAPRCSLPCRSATTLPRRCGSAELAESSLVNALKRLLAEFEIGELARRRPHEVSGGQRQRAGLARAIAAIPDLLLLDEPFVAIDVAARRSMRTRLVQHLAASGSSCVFATHDDADVEAMGAVRVELA